MLRSKRLLSLLAVPAAALLLATSVFASGPPWTEKVTVCHETGSGRVVELHIPLVAAEAHLRHGDVLAGEYGYCPPTLD